jgi:pectate lyase
MMKNPRGIRPWIFMIAALSLVSSAQALALPAFPGAEGFGAVATGGRGGRVIKVTTLQANGPGSLQEALDAPGPRTIVFAVSGVIDGTIRIPHGDVTIAGQTAPGAGITIHGQLFLYRSYGDGADNVIIRHVRIRPPRPTGNIAQFDAIQGGLNTSKLIMDHVSVCGGADETVDLYTSDQVTVQ